MIEPVLKNTYLTRIILFDLKGISVGEEVPFIFQTNKKNNLKIKKLANDASHGIIFTTSILKEFIIKMFPIRGKIIYKVPSLSRFTATRATKIFTRY